MNSSSVLGTKHFNISSLIDATPFQDKTKEHHEIYKLFEKFVNIKARPGSPLSLTFATSSLRGTMILLMILTSCFLVVMARILIRELCRVARKARGEKKLLSAPKAKLNVKLAKSKAVNVLLDRRPTKSAITIIHTGE